jgi:H+/Cl- antiporter ClcA
MNWVWALWLLAIAVSFAAFEGYALATGRKTLSRWTWDLSKAWPPYPCFVGLIVGFLACHFWWGGIVCFAPVQ